MKVRLVKDLKWRHGIMVEGSTSINISSVGAERGIFSFLVCVVNIDWVTYTIGLKGTRSDKGMTVHHVPCKLVRLINSCCAQVFLC